MSRSMPCSPAYFKSEGHFLVCWGEYARAHFADKEKSAQYNRALADWILGGRPLPCGRWIAGWLEMVTMLRKTL